MRNINLISIHIFRISDYNYRGEDEFKIKIIKLYHNDWDLIPEISVSRTFGLLTELT